MSTRTVQALNSFVVVDPVYVAPTKVSSLIDPSTNRERPEEYDRHPFQGLVILAPKCYYNGGYRYESEVKEGDIVLFPGEIIARLMNTKTIWHNGVELFAVRYADLVGFYTPDEEERKNIVFFRDKKDKDDVIKKISTIN